MTEMKLTIENPALAAHVLGVAAIKYEADEDADAVAVCNSLADQITQQVKPVVEEPQEFGSIVRAGAAEDRMLWCRSGSGYWFSESSRRMAFEDFVDPEVLRVGIGTPGDTFSKGWDAGLRHLRKYVVQHASSAPTDRHRDGYWHALNTVAGLLADVREEAGDTYLDNATAYSKGYDKGADDRAAQIAARLRGLRAVAITAPEQEQLDKAIRECR